MNNRFARVELAIGSKKMQKLIASHITVIGVGAVGGFAAEALARSGIGRLTLIDIDCFQRHNINRQIFATEKTIGLPKVEAAKKRLLEINPNLCVDALIEFAHADTVSRLISPETNCVVDATDSVGPKVQLLAFCLREGIPVISSMGAAFKYRFDLITIADISQTLVCPLARAVRKGLRKQGVREGLPVVYSPEPGPPWLDPGEVTDRDLGTGTHRGRPRRILGSLCPLAGVFGMLIAHYIIHRLIETPTDLFMPNC